ncbi:glucose PTS transporter subunit IIA [Propionibacterium australiense]|uniref:Protein-Npi-phosphohistidine-sugar phosphotransferase n=1 Tax=Propionibacterium australiense TaxID=119981 RepID=A0A383S4K0_9ACTN|nr:glucose PTS transporter subunit IIA [Propionibacterium australiense]SYZ32299.1 protein-Npi-phosphohistidine-sugar phosphotransferase [Propionibacterium australiense]VEH90488.1 EIIBCA-Bgl [Propionibacterium australiense]
MLWTLAGTGLFKAFLAMFATLGWINDEGDTYTVLYAASDAFMYFLPLVLAVTAARHFKTNQFTAMAIAGALVYPSIVAMVDTGPHSFAGIPLVIMSYTSSVLPIIVAVWVQSFLERFLMKAIPSAFRNFMTPWIVVLIMVPLTLLTIGPLTTLVANGIATGVQWLFQTIPPLGGIVIGGLWQVFVIFGLHWGLVPIMTQEIVSNDYSLIYGPIAAAVLAQASATLAVMLRTKDAKTKELAGPAALSGFLAGVTEPAIYGVNLPRKYPLYFGIAGGAAGGVICAIAGGRVTQAGIFPSIIGIPAYLTTPNFILWIIGVVVACVIAFALTWFFGVRDAAPAPLDEDKSEIPAAPENPDMACTDGIDVAAPVAGRIIALEDIPDPVFSSGAMGKGLGIIPSDGTIVSPVAGKIVVATDTGHAVGIKSDDGVELLIHIGIDTVTMKGDGFVSLVTKGQQVEAGQELVKVDLSKIEAAGHSTVTALIVTNSAALGAILPRTIGQTLSAGDPALTVVRQNTTPERATQYD